MEMENIDGDQGETADKDEGCDEETNFDDDLTDHNWLIGGDLDDDSVRFNVNTDYVNTDYEAAIHCKMKRVVLTPRKELFFDRRTTPQKESF